MFTVTSPPGEEQATSYAEFSGRWRRLHERIRRRFGTIEYVAVVEPQRRGAAHVHVIFRGGYIPQQWLSRAAQASGFGRIADIRLAGRATATYITKALTEELSDPGVAPPAFFRRVRWSRHWGHAVQAWQRRLWTSWHLVTASPRVAAISAAAHGYDVVEVVGPDPPGGAFDRAVGWYHDLRGYRARQHGRTDVFTGSRS